MDAFWKWLMQANARAVLLAGILVLLVVSGWWLWWLNQPLESQMTHSQFQLTEKEPVFLSEINSFLDSHLSATNLPGKNPFGTVPKYQPPPPPPPPPPPVPAGRTNVVHVSQPPPVVNAQKPLQTPKKETVKLVYHGMLKRPDGRILAWLEDSTSGKSFFYARGEKTADMTIERIRETELVVRQPDGSIVKIQINEPVSFEEGKHVNR